MWKRTALIFSMLAILLAACAPQSLSMPQAATAPRESAPSADNYLKYSVGSGGAAPGQPAPAVERIVIKNATLSIAVNDPVKSMDTVKKMAEEMGGFVVSADLGQSYLDNGVKVPRVSITIRVPADKLDEALARLKAETSQPVINETIQSQDVTAEYTDLQSRLRNAEATEAQLTQIMKNAQTTEEVLAVYDKLTTVRGEIEILKGQIQYYEQSAALSAISVELLANEAVTPLTIGGWQPAGIAKNAIQALINTLKFLGSALIWIVLYVIPVLAVIFLPPFFVIRAILRWRRGRKK